MQPEISGENEDDVLDAAVVHAVLRLGVHAGGGEVFAQNFQRSFRKKGKFVGDLFAVVSAKLSGRAVDGILGK